MQVLSLHVVCNLSWLILREPGGEHIDELGAARERREADDAVHAEGVRNGADARESAIVTDAKAGGALVRDAGVWHQAVLVDGAERAEAVRLEDGHPELLLVVTRKGCLVTRVQGPHRLAAANLGEDGAERQEGADLRDGLLDRKAGAVLTDAEADDEVGAGARGWHEEVLVGAAAGATKVPLLLPVVDHVCCGGHLKTTTTYEG